MLELSEKQMRSCFSETGKLERKNKKDQCEEKENYHG